MKAIVTAILGGLAAATTACSSGSSSKGSSDVTTEAVLVEKGAGDICPLDVGDYLCELNVTDKGESELGVLGITQKRSGSGRQFVSVDHVSYFADGNIHHSYNRNGVAIAYSVNCSGNTMILNAKSTNSDNEMRVKVVRQGDHISSEIYSNQRGTIVQGSGVCRQ